MLLQVTSSEARVRLFRLPCWRRSSLPAWLLRVDLVDVPGLPPPGWSSFLGSTWPPTRPGRGSGGATLTAASSPSSSETRAPWRPSPRSWRRRRRLASARRRDGHQHRARGLALGDDARGPQGGLALGRGGRPLPDRRRRGRDHPSSSTALGRGWCASSGVSSGMTDSGSGLWLTNPRNAHARRRTDLLRPTTKELPV
jgi:hypothetical protein